MIATNNIRKRIKENKDRKGEPNSKEMFLAEVDFNRILVENGKPLETFDKKKKKMIPTPTFVLDGVTLRTSVEPPPAEETEADKD